MKSRFGAESAPSLEFAAEFGSWDCHVPTPRALWTFCSLSSGVLAFPRDAHDYRGNRLAVGEHRTSRLDAAKTVPLYSDGVNTRVALRFSDDSVDGVSGVFREK